MLITSVQSFKLIAWKPWENLITQTCLHGNAVILSKIIFSSAKIHMHFFNMLITFVQSFKLIAWKPLEELITQNCYPMLKANHKLVSVENAVILSKIIFSSAKILMHIFNMFLIYVQSFKLIAWKLWEELITQTFLFESGDGWTDGQGQNIMASDYRHGA